MLDKDLITKTANFVEGKLLGEASGHDWWHVLRVWKLAKRIARNEPDANRLVVELAALLHDIADWKLNNNDLDAGPKAAKQWLDSLDVDNGITEQVCSIIKETSFKGAGVKLKLPTIEAKIIFDADKLDAIGAIGIARTFAYGGHKNREIYNPSQNPALHESFEEYSSSEGHTINHFYEKLLLLRDIMQTNTGRQLAQHRHVFMEKYLEEFYAEWEGKL